MKNLEISFNGNNACISYDFEMNLRKETVHADEKKLKEEAQKIADAVKYLKGFKSFGIGFSPIDYYDNCNCYDVPYAGCTADNKRVKIGYNDQYTIPKAWSKYYSLRLEDVKDIRSFNKFLDVMGIRIEDKVLNQFRKAIKEKKYFGIEL